jgi:endogenous inhibitor of DNA gyrase (YacG/DUF329 family)
MQNSERKDPKHTATVSIDTVQCPWCDAELDGGDLTDYNLSVFQVTCPECGGLSRSSNPSSTRRTR